MEPTNLLFIVSDQHRRDAAGCYGHPLAVTPNIDRLAERGTVFDRAYTTSPICVPARASLATGRYTHQLRLWDSAFPYAGDPPSWAHRLRAAGRRVDSIGKLHFRRAEDDHGFTRSIQPLYVVDGVGDILGCMREGAPIRRKRGEILEAGPGDSSYLRYDVANADLAVRWLMDRAKSPDPKPWALFLSFVCPHPPYLCPPDCFELYPADEVPMPVDWRADDWPEHPAIRHLRRFFDFEEPFDEMTLRRLISAYLGACTHLDRQIGKVLHALDVSGAGDRTRVIYTSDHGEHLGGRGLFGKFTLYEESVGVPLILAGPDVPRGRRVAAPASLVDAYPTALQALGVSPELDGHRSPGVSWWELAARPPHDRTVYGEYHGLGSRDASFMVADRRYKYIRHVGAPPQLFDLASDPDERCDLGPGPLADRYERRLREWLAPHSPEVIDQLAKADQREKIESFGGTDAAKRRGAFHNSPVPGETASFQRFDSD